MSRQYHRGGDFEQPSLMGGDTLQATERLFFALLPDADTKERIVELAQRLRRERGLEDKLVSPERLRVTVHHLGDHRELPQKLIDKALEAGSAVSMRPFELSFHRAGSIVGRPGKSPFVLRSGGTGSEPMLTFHRTLGEAMTMSGLGRWAERRFNPHLTLFHHERIFEEQPIETISWTAREFVLVHSLHGKSVYKTISSWSLHS
jgi:RNA 2',3'-cyclic 3'-phosphodiesterase